VVGQLPNNLLDNDLVNIFVEGGFPGVKGEVCLNPDGRSRTCGIVEFSTRNEANDCLAQFNSKRYPAIYVKPLFKMVYPGVIGDCCSLKAVK